MQEKKINQSPSQSGQGLVEYVALTALIAIVSIGAVKAFGSKVQKRLSQITTSFDKNIQQGLKSRHLGSSKEGSGGGFELPGGIRLPKGIKLPGGFGFPSKISDDGGDALDLE